MIKCIYCKCISANVPMPTAQFIVHVRGPGVVALQNVKNPNLWLRIKDSKLQSKVTMLRIGIVDV